MAEGSSNAPGLPSTEERARAAATGMALALWAKYRPDAPAIFSAGGNRSFFELNANANRLARALRARGLHAGDSVAVVASNRPEFAEIVFACTRSGLRYTPINRYLSADEIAYIVNDCHARALVGDALFAPLMEQTAARCPAVAVRLSLGGAIAGFEPYAEALEAQDASDIEAPVLGARMLYTSGTTGRPKGVVRPPNYSTQLEAINSAPRYQAGTGQLNLCTGPFYHGGPLSFSLIMPLSHGIGIVIMEKFDAEQALRLIAEHRITHTHMVPTMFHRLLRLPEAVRRAADVSSMQYILHGAAPCPVAAKQGMLDWFGPILWEYFAATEGSGTSCSPQQWSQKPGTVGKPPTPDHVRILDDEGRPCAPGVVGNIFLKGAGELDFAYLNDPDKTASVRRGAHFTVGDIGYLDEDGFLFITDRSASVIISGGVNIYPAEVEAVLLQHPAVKDVAVIGIPNEEWGEEVKAVVQPERLPQDSDAFANELIAYCRQRIAHFKCPRSIDFVEQLPRDDNGKMYRLRLLSSYNPGARPPSTDGQ
jgi:long-chain acyl-CoA synthetase